MGRVATNLALLAHPSPRFGPRCAYVPTAGFSGAARREGRVAKYRPLQYTPLPLPSAPPPPPSSRRSDSNYLFYSSSPTSSTYSPLLPLLPLLLLHGYVVPQSPRVRSTGFERRPAAHPGVFPTPWSPWTMFRTMFWTMFRTMFRTDLFRTRHGANTGRLLSRGGSRAWRAVRTPLRHSGVSGGVRLALGSVLRGALGARLCFEPSPEHLGSARRPPVQFSPLVFLDTYVDFRLVPDLSVSGTCTCFVVFRHKCQTRGSGRNCSLPFSGGSGSSGPSRPLFPQVLPANSDALPENSCHADAQQLVRVPDGRGPCPSSGVHASHYAASAMFPTASGP